MIEKDGPDKSLPRAKMVVERRFVALTRGNANLAQRDAIDSVCSKEAFSSDDEFVTGRTINHFDLEVTLSRQLFSQHGPTPCGDARDKRRGWSQDHRKTGITSAVTHSRFSKYSLVDRGIGAMSILTTIVEQCGSGLLVRQRERSDWCRCVRARRVTVDPNSALTFHRRLMYCH